MDSAKIFGYVKQGLEILENYFFFFAAVALVPAWVSVTFTVVSGAKSSNTLKLKCNGISGKSK